MILGSAPDALFLREPINQSHLTRGGDTTVFDVDPNSTSIGYALYEDRAFNGIPLFTQGEQEIPNNGACIPVYTSGWSSKKSIRLLYLGYWKRTSHGSFIWLATLQQ